MKSISHDEQVQDWVKLVAAAREEEPRLLNLGDEPLVADLEAIHARALSLLSRREELLASARAMTVELKETFAAGFERTVSLRSLIRAKLGPRSERLEQFGIKPLRKRRRRSRKDAKGRRLAS